VKKIFAILYSIVLSCSLCTADTLAERQAQNQPARVRLTLPSQHKVEGTWLGNLEVFGLEYTLVFKICRNPDGTLTATIDSPDQGTNDIPADKVECEDSNLQIEATSIPAVFDGKIKEDGLTIEGHWKQSGLVLPLTVKRVSEAELNKLLEDKSYTKVFSPNELKEDLDFLFKTIEEVHPNMYAYISKEEFKPLRDELYRQINRPMTRLEFYKAVAPVVAQLKNGHTFMQPPSGAFAEYIRKGGRLFPLEFQWDGTAVILKSCASGDDLPIGGEVLAIDNQKAREFLVRTARYFPAENKPYNLGLLESGSIFPMFLWLEKGDAKSMTISSKTMDGVIKEYVVKPLSRNEIESQATANETKHTTVTSDKNPNYSYRYIPEQETGLIEFNACADLEKFKEFLVEAFNTIKEQNPGNLIIDIRENSGGDSSVGDEFLKYLTDKPFRQFEKIQLKISKQMCKQYKSLGGQAPDGKIGSLKSSYIGFTHPGDNRLRFKGRVFVLIGPRTASSAMCFAQAIKHFAIGTLVGQETEDTPVNYGECIRGGLPNTGLGFSVACKRFVNAGAVGNGRGVLPDYEVKQKPQDTVKGIDTVLEFTLNLIKNSETKK